jgi:hypothetical protein
MQAHAHKEHYRVTAQDNNESRVYLHIQSMIQCFDAVSVDVCLSWIL